MGVILYLISHRSKTLSGISKNSKKSCCMTEQVAPKRIAISICDCKGMKLGWPGTLLPTLSEMHTYSFSMLLKLLLLLAVLRGVSLLKLISVSGYSFSKKLLQINSSIVDTPKKYCSTMSYFTNSIYT